MKSLLLALALMLTIQTSNSQTNGNSNNTASKVTEDITVYYFHYTRRCATCNAVESVAKETVSELKNNSITFLDFNLDNSDGEIKGKELEISGQTLVIVKNKVKVDITNEAFLNARSKPEKLKKIINEEIEKLLK